MASSNKKSTLRAWYLAITTMFASFLNGYDTGVAGGVLTFESFYRDFGYNSKTRMNQIKSFTVGFQLLGSFVSSLFVYPLMDRYGRRKPIMVSMVIFLIGVIIETINTGSLTAWYIGRVIAGMGQGAATSVVPVYLAEMAPKEIRLRLGSMYQGMFTIGIFLSYWIDYAVQQNIPSTQSKQWQIPIGIQSISGIGLLLSMFTLKESCRWLLKKDREDEALQSLVWIRASDGPEVQEELDQIKIGLDAEIAGKHGFKIKELITPVNQRRFFLGWTTFIFQQATGSTALAYFGPQFFSRLVGDNPQQALLITGLFGAIKIIACFTFIFFISERFGRRGLMAGGALVMASCMLSTGLVNKYYPAEGHIGDAQRATVALIFLNIVAYNGSWGPIPWTYVPEIFPNRIRELGMASSVSVHWLFSFMFTVATPYMLDALGWGTFVFYCVCDVLMAAFVWVFFKEARNKTLETIDREFQKNSQRGVLDRETRAMSEEEEEPLISGDRGKAVNNRAARSNGLPSGNPSHASD